MPVTSQLLNDVDAARVGTTGIAPGDRIVTGDSAATLQGSPIDRIAHRPDPD